MGVPLFIDECLYHRCELGHALDFVHDYGGWMEREETTVIVFGKFARFGVFKIDIGIPGKTGLPALSTIIIAHSICCLQVQVANSMDSLV